MKPRTNLPVALGCAVLLLLVAGCEAQPSGPICIRLAERCGAGDPDGWMAWCESDCVTEHARTTPCEANDVCVLCDEPRSDGQTIHFGLPSDLEYLWTYTMGDERVDPRPIEPPTGGAFDDTTWTLDGDRVGAWAPLQPYDVEPLSGEGYCEPGPNQFLSSNVTAEGDRVVLSAVRTSDAAYCDYPNCSVGPYTECGAVPATFCPYGDAPEMRGVGTSAQLDRALGAGGEPATYGYGRYRSIHATGTDSTPPTPGVVYAFFAQSNAYCVGGAANPLSNTEEIDIEISSGTGSIYGAGAFCTEGDMCFQLVNWVSSEQGIPPRTGSERRETSAFRFRDPAIARDPHTWGWDWSADGIRYTYDSDPYDCDEAAGECPVERGSLVMCHHARYIPHRPSALHLQLWNARWAGDAPEGTRAEMPIERVWHVPAAD